jgi:DNA (cytosine-5)-methyltransferase 1
MRARFAVVDLFAGPGGLAEGFSAVRTPEGFRPFKLTLSVEKERAAHETLLLRAFLRQFRSGFPDEYYNFLNGGGNEPDWPSLYPAEWRAAENEALRLELGSPQAERTLVPRLEALRALHSGDTVLIGGPPCQAYSLVGRSRNRGVRGYVAEDDPKHFLYKEYVRILRNLKPAAFVMENVKGLLSASVSGANVLQQVLQDVSNVHRDVGYQLVALAPRRSQQILFESIPAPVEFVIRAEEHGVPQARHRIIIVGIRRDVLNLVGTDIRAWLPFAHDDNAAAVEDVLDCMPKLRSGLSRGEETPEAWAQAVRDAAKTLLGTKVVMSREHERAFRARLRECAGNAGRFSAKWPLTASRPAGIGKRCSKKLRSWLTDPRLKALPNHGSRFHMPSDLARYLFASIYAEVVGVSPKAEVFPSALAPEHDNWGSGDFRDRFRVQLWGKPATTITSHISKDGHSFIHPDPEQCRSLTVREAARLQTFPDNYYFKGTRTEQFVQVGNAVPPYLAMQIGAALYSLLNEYVARRSLDVRKAAANGRGAFARERA